MLATPSHGGGWRAVACRRLVDAKGGPCVAAPLARCKRVTRATRLQSKFVASVVDFWWCYNTSFLALTESDFSDAEHKRPI
jgi:hypothetical protein